jgi:hypothetical protein
LSDYVGPAAETAKPKAGMKTVETVDSLIEKIVVVLGKSHCFFADLLDKFSKADYKTIASAVARLYEEGKIGQDKDGKFELKGQ